MTKFICSSPLCHAFWINLEVKGQQAIVHCCCGVSDVVFFSPQKQLQAYQCSSCKRLVWIRLDPLSLRCNQCAETMHIEQIQGPLSIVTPEIEKLILQYYPHATAIHGMNQGGMADVFGFYDETHKHIVLKKLCVETKNVFEQRDCHNRFQQEARIQQEINSPTIAKVYQYGSSSTGPFLLMEYIEGERLDVWMKNKPSNQEILAMMEKICHAVAFLHTHPAMIVHRDLKPENIMIRSGQPVILDLGIAKIQNVAHDLCQYTQLTQNMRMIGTPGYMSPEQMYGQIYQQSPASDVFSLGIIFYEMLSHCHPFLTSQEQDQSPSSTRQPFYEVYRQSLQSRAIPLQERIPKLSSDLDYICQKALELSPQQRYRHAQEMEQDIHRYIHGQTVFIRLSRMVRYASWCRKHPIGIAVAVFLLVLLVIGFVSYEYGQYQQYQVIQQFQTEINQQKKYIQIRWRRMLKYHCIDSELAQSLKDFHYITEDEYKSLYENKTIDEDNAGFIASWQWNLLPHYQKIKQIYFWMDQESSAMAISQDHLQFLQEYYHFSLVCYDFTTAEYLKNECEVWSEQRMIQQSILVEFESKYQTYQQKMDEYFKDFAAKKP